MKKKKITVDTSNLSTDQITFIQNKVRELGTVAAVEAVYRKEDAVTKFAHDFAKVLYCTTTPGD